MWWYNIAIYIAEKLNIAMSNLLQYLAALIRTYLTFSDFYSPEMHKTIDSL